MAVKLHRQHSVLQPPPLSYLMNFAALLLLLLYHTTEFDRKKKSASTATTKLGMNPFVTVIETGVLDEFILTASHA